MSKDVDDVSTRQPESMKESTLEGNSDDVSKLKKFLRDPTVNVNSVDKYGATALHYACKNGQDRIMTLLLAHPGIVVNQKNPEGMTPFMMACLHGRSLCAYIMLKDSRVNVNEPDDASQFPRTPRGSQMVDCFK